MSLNRPVGKVKQVKGSFRAISGRVLSAAAMTAHNTFQAPRAIEPAQFTAAKITPGGFTAELPAKSVVVLELK